MRRFWLALCLAILTACAQTPPTGMRGTGDLGLVVERASGRVVVVDTTARQVLGAIEGLGDLSHASVVFGRDGRYAFVFGRDGGLTQVGIPAAEVRARLTAMLDTGVIRRIGAVPNHYALGYRFNGMTVWDVDDAQVDALGREVGALPFVSHCYRRPRRLPDWPYNLFAMVHAKSRAAALAQVERIAAVLGAACRHHDVLFSSRILKKTGLRLVD